MVFLLIGTGLLTACLLLLVLLVWPIVIKLKGRRPERWWARTLKAHLLLVPLYGFVVLPALMGWFVATRVGTRGDERDYAGPRLDAEGRWLVQDRASLGNGETVDRAIRDAATGRAVRIVADDGVAIRGWWVPRSPRPRPLTAVCVHGLFRGGLEIDAVGAMFRELGLDVLLIEMRNHGGSDRAPFTGGLQESRDVVAATRWVQIQAGHAGDRIVLFGVSLGTAAVALALPHVDRLAALVIDAPVSDLRGTAHRLLAPKPEGTGRIGFPEPFRSTCLWFFEAFSSADLDAVKPLAALATLPSQVPVLVIGGGDDGRMPPDEVRDLYAGLTAPAGVKDLWIRDGSGHGKVWIDDPEGYLRRLRALISRIP
ncbi:MAG: hypothetical protein CMJ83_22750 [Planctomycetes bacterium]|nr:hypothetical protein [Planctomycetota bacterium]